jgi:hypothetical protein
MFYEYAIDPAVFTTFDRVRYFLDAVEPGEGRLLSEFPNKWRTLVFDQLPQIAGNSRKTAELRLHRAKMIRRKGASFDPERTWISNAVSQNAISAFRAVVTESGADDENHLCATTVDITHPLWSKCDSFVPRSIDEIVPAIALLLVHAQRVTIIDPFIGNDKQRRAKLFEGFAHTARDDAHFEAYCQPLESGDVAKRQLQENLKKLSRYLRARQQLTATVLTPKIGGQRFHNRYLLSRVGGVQFGDSIEAGDGEDSLSALSTKKLETLMRDYSTNTTAFDVVDTFSFAAT